MVTIDAMGCQKKIATQVLQKGADYLLSVKGNPPALADAFEAALPMAKVASFEGDSYVTDEKNRGRQETRYHIVSEVTEEFQELSYEWAGLKTVGVVMSFRQKGDEVPEAPMIRYSEETEESRTG